MENRRKKGRSRLLGVVRSLTGKRVKREGLLRLLLGGSRRRVGERKDSPKNCETFLMVIRAGEVRKYLYGGTRDQKKKVARKSGGRQVKKGPGRA